MFKKKNCYKKEENETIKKLKITIQAIGLIVLGYITTCLVFCL